MVGVNLVVKQQSSKGPPCPLCEMKLSPVAVSISWQRAFDAIRNECVLIGMITAFHRIGSCQQFQGLQIRHARHGDQIAGRGIVAKRPSLVIPLTMCFATGATR